MGLSLFFPVSPHAPPSRSLPLSGPQRQIKVLFRWATRTGSLPPFGSSWSLEIPSCHSWVIAFCFSYARRCQLASSYFSASLVGTNCLKSWFHMLGEQLRHHNKPRKKKVVKVSRFGCAGHRSSLTSPGGLEIATRRNLKHMMSIFLLQHLQILHAGPLVWTLPFQNRAQRCKRIEGALTSPNLCAKRGSSSSPSAH